MSLLGWVLFVLMTRYHVPRSVQAHIDYITPGVKAFKVGSPVMPRPERSLHKRANASDAILGSDILLSDLLDDAMAYCDQIITPGCIKGTFYLLMDDANE